VRRGCDRACEPDPPDAVAALGATPGNRREPSFAGVLRLALTRWAAVVAFGYSPSTTSLPTATHGSTLIALSYLAALGSAQVSFFAPHFMAQVQFCAQFAPFGRTSAVKYERSVII